MSATIIRSTITTCSSSSFLAFFLSLPRFCFSLPWLRRLSHRVTADHALQPFQPRLEIGIFVAESLYLLRLLRSTFFESLHSDHQDSRHVAGVDGRRGPNGAHAIVPEGGVELLGHGAIVAEFFEVMANVIPTTEGKAADLL